MELAIRVGVVALDPITESGMVAHLGTLPDVSVVSGSDQGSVDVVVVTVDRMCAQSVEALRTAASEHGCPVVLIANEIKDDELLLAVECRVVAILPRPAVSDERLRHAVRAAAGGGGAYPPDLLGELLKHVQRLRTEVLEPRGLSPRGLTAREVEVLRLMAEGSDTAEIAQTLCYSERTVKNVVSGITGRLQLRNRSHAVAYALRAGVI